MYGWGGATNLNCNYLNNKEGILEEKINPDVNELLLTNEEQEKGKDILQEEKIEEILGEEEELTQNCKLSIVLLCFNKLEFTKKCIESILKNTFHDNYELIIVNNGSIDNTFKYLNKIKNDKIKVIHNKSNLGFSKGMNIGVKNAKGDYLILLHNDTIVGEGWEVELINILKNDENIFAVTPSTNFSDNESKYEIEHSDYNNYFNLYNDLRHKFISHFTASSLTLFCCCFRRKDFIKLGFLDEYYFNEFEDDDLYERIINLNKIVSISTQSVVYHFGGITISHNYNKLNYYKKLYYYKLNYVNRLYFEKKWRKKWSSKSKINYDRKLNFENLKILEEYKFYDDNSVFFKDIIKCYVDFYKKFDINIQITNSFDEKIILFDLFRYGNKELPKDFIIFNLEQILWGKEKLWERETNINRKNIFLYKNAKIIFDYSLLNLRTWFENGIYNIIFHPEPIFYLDENPSFSKKILQNKIIFYGELTERRKNILNNLDCNNIEYSQTLFGDKKNNKLDEKLIILELSSFNK